MCAKNRLQCLSCQKKSLRGKCGWKQLSPHFSTNRREQSCSVFWAGSLWNARLLVCTVYLVWCAEEFKGQTLVAVHLYSVVINKTNQQTVRSAAFLGEEARRARGSALNITNSSGRNGKKKKKVNKKTKKLRCAQSQHWSKDKYKRRRVGKCWNQLLHSRF